MKLLMSDLTVDQSKASEFLIRGKKLLNLSPEGKLRDNDRLPYSLLEWSKLAQKYLEECDEFFVEMGEQSRLNKVLAQYDPLVKTDSLVVTIFQYLKALEHISDQRLVLENCADNQQVFGNYVFTFNPKKLNEIQSVSFMGKPLNMRGNVISKVLYAIVSKSYLNNEWADLRHNEMIPVETNLAKEVKTLNDKLLEVDPSIKRHIVGDPKLPKTYRINE